MSTRNSTGKVLLDGWKKNSLSYFEYIKLARTIGKEQAAKKYLPLKTYIDLAYSQYRAMCYYFGKQPFSKGKWLLSDFN